MDQKKTAVVLEKLLSQFGWSVSVYGGIVLCVGIGIPDSILDALGEINVQSLGAWVDQSMFSDGKLFLN